MKLVLGSHINRTIYGSRGFDAFSANLEEKSFALCDGANSCENSGIAARWLARAITEYSVNQTDPNGYEKHLFKLHLQMQTEFPNTGSTAIWVSAAAPGLTLISVGDSFLQVYRKYLFGLGGWRDVVTMPRDLDQFSNPTQLIGSDVFKKVNVERIACKGAYIILMMTDGPADSIAQPELCRILSYVKHREPSTYDLDYLSAQIIESAFRAGCTDDASVALIWIKQP
jgi:serine/threonine protein phosphatase PrpC